MTLERSNSGFPPCGGIFSSGDNVERVLRRISRTFDSLDSFFFVTLRLSSGFQTPWSVAWPGSLICPNAADGKQR
jgi:hypothetical protein